MSDLYPKYSQWIDLLNEQDKAFLLILFVSLTVSVWLIVTRFGVARFLPYARALLPIVFFGSLALTILKVALR